MAKYEKHGMNLNEEDCLGRKVARTHCVRKLCFPVFNSVEGSRI